MKNIARYIVVAAVSSVVVASAMYRFVVLPRDEAIDRISARADTAESVAEKYERTNTRAEMRAANGAQDFQVWAQDQPEYFEQVNGTECLVRRVTKDVWRVTKRHIGGSTMWALDSSVGGPAACDRMPYRQ